MVDLFFGDCLKVMQTMEIESVDFTLTDIPYNAVNRKDKRLALKWIKITLI